MRQRNVNKTKPLKPSPSKRMRSSAANAEKQRTGTKLTGGSRFRKRQGGRHSMRKTPMRTAASRFEMAWPKSGKRGATADAVYLAIGTLEIASGQRDETWLSAGRGAATWRNRGRGAGVLKWKNESAKAAVAQVLAAVGQSHRLTILETLLDGSAVYRTLQKVTKLKAGPLYHHIHQLRLASLILPKQRDLYELTRAGRNLILIALGIERFIQDVRRRPVGVQDDSA